MRAADGIIAPVTAGSIHRRAARPQLPAPTPLLRPLALVLAIALSAAAPSLAEAPAGEGWISDLGVARERAKNENKPILVDLWAVWCTWCKRLEEDVFTKPVFQEFAKSYVLLRVDTDDGASGRRLMVDFEVDSLPTMLVLTHDLIKIGELEGYLSAEPYVQSLALELAVYQELLDQYEQRSQASATATATPAAVAVADPLQTLADELHARHDGARAATLYREIIDRAAAAEKGSGNPEERAWNRFYYADSLRLKHDLEGARREAVAAREAAAGIDNDELNERIELLSFYLARDADACTEARQVIDRFLVEHPEGVLVDLAREEQRQLKTAEGCA